MREKRRDGKGMSEKRRDGKGMKRRGGMERG